MSDLLNFFKELFLIKKEEPKIIGLSTLKKSVNKVAKKSVKKKKEEKEIKISDLMRRHKVSEPQQQQQQQQQPKAGTIRPAQSAVYTNKNY